MTLKRLETFQQKVGGKKQRGMEIKKILVVDDEKEIRTIMLEVLSFLGYEAEVAVNGEEALAIFNEAEHDLLIVDSYMPRMQGAELIRTLVQKCPSLPVIAMTGAGFKTEEVLLAAGARECLGKPIDIGQLQEAIEKVFEEKKSNPGLRQEAVPRNKISYSPYESPGIENSLGVKTDFELFHDFDGRGRSSPEVEFLLERNGSDQGHQPSLETNSQRRKALHFLDLP
jgi:CheY-like chemotaxis protein